MSSLARETVALLLTDVQGSTRLWEQEAEAMQVALARHDALADEIFTAHAGRLVKPRGEGDSLFAVFSHASNAVAAAGALQRAYQQEAWPTTSPLHVRMAIHVGEAIGRDGDYYGPTVNRCARIRAIAHGGQILLSQAAYSLTCDTLMNTAAVIRDLGEHRLRDLERPEQIYQLNWPGCPAEFPRIASLDAYKHNLPRHLTSFIGREREIAEVQRLLQHSPLVTIMGSGGAGKTRLAQQVAAESLERYTDGVWLVELAALADPDLAPKAVANALGVPEEPGRPMLETLCRRLSAQRLLLILDNCEHMERACALVAHTLLRACPNLNVLATSRSRLGVAGEVIWSLPSLPVPTGAAPAALQAALEYEGIRLFVDRAIASRPAFALTAANLPATVQICCRLDGIPLAIELAAARVAVLTPEDIAVRMERSFRLFKNSDRLAMERHQTLDALIDWSYNLLNEPQRILLRRLSLFVGGWSLAAVEAVCADEQVDAADVLDVLSELINASLVIAEEQDGAGRYRLLETVRRYSRKKLEQAGEAETFQQRHRHYFAVLAESALPHLTTGAQATWLARLEAEHDNFRTVLSAPGAEETRLKLAGALWRFWLMHGHFSEGRRWLEAALHCDPDVSDSIRGRALTGLGMLMVQHNDQTSAYAILDEALALRRATGDARDIAETINILGIAARARGDLDRARECCEESLQLRRQIGDAWGIAAAYNNLAMIAYDQKDLDTAQDYYTQSLELYRDFGDAHTIAMASNNLGTAYHEREQYALAEELFATAASLSLSLNDYNSAVHAMHNLGDTRTKLQRHQEAIDPLAACIRIALEQQNFSYLFYPLNTLAKVALALAKPALAARLLGLSSAECGRSGFSILSTDEQDHAALTRDVRAALSAADFAAEFQRGTRLQSAQILDLIDTEMR